MEFAISWFADPIYFGHYPKTMIAQLGNRLPQWTDKEVALVKDSNDFFGMNHYCSTFVKTKIGKPERTDTVGNVDILLQNKAGEWIGPETQSTWLRPSAIGFCKLLKWLSDRYGQPKIYVTENGTSVKGENDLPLEQALKDDFRVQYFEDYIGAMAEAYTYDKVNVRAYMAWSMME
jgi:beta-glucosidase